MRLKWLSPLWMLSHWKTHFNKQSLVDQQKCFCKYRIVIALIQFVSTQNPFDPKGKNIVKPQTRVFHIFYSISIYVSQNLLFKIENHFLFFVVNLVLLRKLKLSCKYCRVVYLWSSVFRCLFPVRKTKLFSFFVCFHKNVLLWFCFPRQSAQT